MDNKGGKKYIIRRKDLFYPELSFKLNGIFFEVAKQLGGGHQEKYYQKAIKIGFEKSGIKFIEQAYVPLKFDNEIVGKYFLDFLVEDKIVIEIKRGEFISRKIIDQTKQYLETLDLKLGLLVCFTHGGAIIKRVVNE
ncbi:MAG: GxxExxY protein [Candidatus Magasanikbacteria bacterium]